MKNVNEREDGKEDESIYWINLREREGIRILGKKH
jgi:hypothetical protein